nr:MAG TPA: hypothetical protein [Caudoviricetes sp.]
MLGVNKGRGARYRAVRKGECKEYVKICKKWS